MVGTKNSGRPGGNPKIAQISKLYATGPKTPIGKWVSSQNSYKHGMYSKNNTLTGLTCTNCEAHEFCSSYTPNHSGCFLREQYRVLSNLRDMRYNNFRELLPIFWVVEQDLSCVETLLLGCPQALTLKISRKIIRLLCKSA